MSITTINRAQTRRPLDPTDAKREKTSPTSIRVTKDDKEWVADRYGTFTDGVVQLIADARSAEHTNVQGPVVAPKPAPVTPQPELPPTPPETVDYRKGEGKFDPPTLWVCVGLGGLACLVIGVIIVNTKFPSTVVQSNYRPPV